MIPATILVIAKEPRPGHAKTRLCPPCTPQESAAIATAALFDTFETVARTPVRRRIAVLDGRAGRWLPAGFEVVPQSSGRLAQRLGAAFAGTDGPTVLVGMDTPQLTSPLLTGALIDLMVSDAVLGRACDGGWWAIGLHHPDARVFDGLPMSTAQTGSRQLERLRKLGLRTHVLPELRDVDHFSDARAVAAAMPPNSRFARTVETVSRAIERRVPEPAQ